MTTPVEKPDPTMDQEQVEDIELKPTSDNPRVHLVPRPSEDEADPLNWPMKLKILILVQVCWLAFVSSFSGETHHIFRDNVSGPQANQLSTKQ